MGTNVKRVVLLAILCVSSISWLAFFVPPETFVFFHVWAFLIPFLLLTGFSLAVFGIIKKDKWLTFFSCLAFLGNIYYIPFIFQPFHQSLTDPSPADLRIITYNVAKFQMKHNMPSLMHISDFLIESNPKIICLQEVSDEQTIRLLQKMTKMPYLAVSDGIPHDQRLAVLSQHPLAKHRTLHFPGRPHLAQLVDIILPNRRVRLMNCHLQTTNINQVMKSKNMGLLQGVKLILKNAKIRGEQAEMLQKELSIHAVNIICGDFNVPPISYSYSRLKGDLKDAFKTAGIGYGYTYRYMMKFFRIDYVFYDEQHFKALRYRTENLEYSDHLPVVVDMKYKVSDDKQ
ncbi:endonuclease/exonuclease/phosphatase family protein [Sphingobacterium hotanense]|uniref:endonuclease/exonuclease/phosphatase family protein n=1 Tax=Sphingobacterium hotanense TaxID=649196 RepID=UPI0021A86F95|nr:endonuclease/exonuclease/phosphatase family protein [Sphingobacterium hotanense]MCT1524674.1 endonuclease/exonuclease/phosphatase family protein [Sphingobacterium hotanense]